MKLWFKYSNVQFVVSAAVSKCYHDKWYTVHVLWFLRCFSVICFCYFAHTDSTDPFYALIRTFNQSLHRTRSYYLHWKDWYSNCRTWNLAALVMNNCEVPWENIICHTMVPTEMSLSQVSYLTSRSRFLHVVLDNICCFQGLTCMTIIHRMEMAF